MRKHFQGWLLVFVSAACIITISGSYWIYRNMQRENAITLIRQTLSSAKNQIDQSQENLRAIQKLSDASALAKARAFVKILNEQPRPSVSAADLEKIKKLLDVDELQVFDDKGILIAGIPDKYKGMDIRKLPQFQEFEGVLKDKSFEAVQQHAENNALQYACAARQEKPGFVLIGYEPERLAEAMRMADVKTIAGLHRLGNHGQMRIERNPGGKTNIERIFEEQDNERSSLCISMTYGKYRLTGSLPKSEVYASGNFVLRVLIIGGLIVFGGIFVLTVILFYTSAVTKLRAVNKSLHQINDGDLDVRIKVRSASEFEDLSDGINKTVMNLKTAKDKEKKIADDMGKTIQRSILPSNFPDNPYFSLAANLYPAKTSGGDFYDFFRVDRFHTALFIGDVSDRGIAAALFMLKAKNLLRELAQPGCDPAVMLTAVNQKLCENNKSQMFVSVFFAILNQVTGNLAYVCAGHPRPLVKQGDAEWEFLPGEKSLVLGVSVKAQYMTEEIGLCPGDRLFAYTNGATETADPAEKMFGSQRLLMFLNASEENLMQLTGKFYDVLTEFSGEKQQNDDVTLMTLDFYRNQEDAGGCSL